MRALARIFPRLLLFNVLLVFLPAAGLLYLDTYEQQLLRSQERAMVQQGRVLAAALGGGGELAAADAVGVLTRLERRLDARLRIVDAAGDLLADSSRLGPRREAGDEPAADPYRRQDGRESWLYRLGALGTLAVQRLLHASPPGLESGEIYDGRTRLDGDEIRAALGGRYGAATRISSGGQRSVTLYSAIPVRDGERVVGAVLVSQSTSRILSELIEVRLDIFRTFLASVAVAVVLTLVFSATIARPLARLRLQALAIVDRRGRLKGRFEGSRRRDEIGDLARALEALSRRVEGHQGKLEAFASDVAHELKNPLASIRNATELLAEVDDPAARRRFRAMVEKDVARMEHVLSEVRELALLDAGQGAGTPVVDLRRTTAEVVEGYRLRGDTNALELDQGTEPVPVAAHPEHLTQVMTNLLDNALSFAPTGSAVAVAVGRDAGGAWLAVADAGPGVAPAERERIFDRFYSARPEGSNGHLGLGLAIVHAIASSYGGDVTCDAGGGGGARFTVRLPLA